MSNSIEVRVQKLEKQLDEYSPGKRLAFRLHWYLSVSGSLMSYVYHTEMSRPIKNPGLENTQSKEWQKNYSERLKEWRLYRQSSWKEKFWTIKWRSGSRYLVQEDDDPNIPTERETRELFGQIVACCPPEVFVWADALYKAIIRKSGGYVTNEWIGSYTVAKELRCIQSRADYWRRRLSNHRFEEILLPEWAINIYKDKNKNPDWKFPPFK